MSTGGLGGLALGARLALGGSLAGLDLLKGGITLRGTDLGLLRGTLADVIQRDTDNSASDLVGATPGLLRGVGGDSLLVEAAPGLGPHKLGGLLPLHRQAKGLG